MRSKGEETFDWTFSAMMKRQRLQLRD